MVEWEDVEFASPHKYIQNTSTNGTILTEHLLDTSRGPWTLKGKKNSLHNWVG